MRLISVITSLFVLIGVVQCTFPNDLYYHHHPEELKKASKKNQIHGNYAKPHRYDSRPSRYDRDRSSHHRGSGRANYHEGTRHRFEPRSYSDEADIYNRDGSINWSYKAADNTRGSNRHRPYDDDYYMRSSYDRYSYDDEDDYDNNDDYYDDDSYYGDEEEEESSYRDQGSRHGNRPQSGRQRGNGNDRQQGNNNDRQQDASNDDAEQDQDQDNKTGLSAKYGQTGGNFGGGLRLAGALPDDGYNRGLGTFYDLETHTGSCGKQYKNSDLVASVNSEQMNNGCGKQVEIIGPSGTSIKAHVVDNCKTCKAGGLDLSPAAYEKLGDFSHGSVPIKWKFV